MSGSDGKSVFRDAVDVARWRMCVGCGACVSACDEGKLRLVDIVDQGLRPSWVGVGGDCDGCSSCVSVCPGVGVSHVRRSPEDASAMAQLTRSWGTVLEIWEGHASDGELHFLGSSAGLASALSVYCVEREQMQGVLHVGRDDAVGFRNKTQFSRTRREVLEATGSRYAPASPCDSFGVIEGEKGPCVFIGKPCDIEGLRKAQEVRARLRENVGVAISIFCAGTPSTQGTVDLLRKYDVDPNNVDEVRYRGRGWPGSLSVRLKNEADWKVLATYEDAWGFLQQYRPYRCYLCPDGTGEFADISCGDPWYREIEEGELGTSLVIVRTETGRRIVRAAREAGYVNLKPVKPEVLDLSQRELQLKRGAIWGRVLTMQAMGIPAPRFIGFSLFANWLRIPGGHKVRSIVGTARRILGRKYYKPLQMDS